MGQEWDHFLDKVLFGLWIFVICLGIYEMRDLALHHPDVSHTAIVLP